MQQIIDLSERLMRLSQQFANIAAGRPEYNQFGNGWKIPGPDAWTL